MTINISTLHGYNDNSTKTLTKKNEWPYHRILLSVRL